jgi:hypothetical protein
MPVLHRPTPRHDGHVTGQLWAARLAGSNVLSNACQWSDTVLPDQVLYYDTAAWSNAVLVLHSSDEVGFARRSSLSRARFIELLK